MHAVKDLKEGVEGEGVGEITQTCVFLSCVRALQWIICGAYASVRLLMFVLSHNRIGVAPLPDYILPLGGGGPEKWSSVYYHNVRW